jgi:uncharacterized membrane protein
MSEIVEKARGNAFLPYSASFVAGFAVCLALTIASGGREAVDTAGYLTIGIPLMAVTIFAISYAVPARPARWTLSMAAGQMIAMFLTGSGLSMWPIAIVFMLIYSTPQFIAGYFGSRMGRRRSAGA